MYDHFEYYLYIFGYTYNVTWNPFTVNLTNCKVDSEWMPDPRSTNDKSNNQGHTKSRENRLHTSIQGKIIVLTKNSQKPTCIHYMLIN